jgi:hypothetical protein
VSMPMDGSLVAANRMARERRVRFKGLVMVVFRRRRRFEARTGRPRVLSLAPSSPITKATRAGLRPAFASPPQGAVLAIRIGMVRMGMLR